MASLKTQTTANTGSRRLAISLIVCLQFIGYLPANAADAAQSDKANWIKQNLATMVAHKDFRKPTQVAKAPQPTNMMPFVPNRHLPTQQELQQHLMDEQAQFDNNVGSQTVLQRQTAKFDNLPLNGTVSTYVAQPMPTSDRETRAWQDEAAAALKHITGNHGKVAHKHQKSMPTMASTRSYPVAADRYPASPNNQSIRQTGALLIESPMLTPNERTMVDGMNQMGTPADSEQTSDAGLPLLNANDNPQAPASEFGSAGPPPFPLNLIPPQALHDMIARGHHQKINAPQAFFGSWHGANAQSLPSSGFRSNLSGQPRLCAQRFGFYAPMVKSYARSNGTPGRRRHARKVIAPAQITPTVLTYPAYSRVSMF